MYVKAGRPAQVPVALEVSRSGVGAHAWVFFTSPVPAELARRLGTGLLREAMALRGKMSLASYDRLFPSQDCHDGHPPPAAGTPGRTAARSPGSVQPHRRYTHPSLITAHYLGSLKVFGELLAACAWMGRQERPEPVSPLPLRTTTVVNRDSGGQSRSEHGQHMTAGRDTMCVT